MPPESRPNLKLTETTVYRVEQLEKKFDQLMDALGKLTVELSAINTQQQVHMAQTTLMQVNNESKMSSIGETVESLTDAKDGHGVQLAELKVHQSFAEKYGPTAGVSAVVASGATALIELIMKFVNSAA